VGATKGPVKAGTWSPAEAEMTRLRDYYRQEVIPAMMNEFAYDNVMQVPKVTKIVLNVSLKEGIRDIKILETAANELGQVTGQKAIVRRARRSIANFKLREGMPIGTMVTLRRDRMYEFLDRLISIAIPRVRDFRGLNGKSFDGRGNYSMGFQEQIVFQEIDYDKVARITGMNITMVTNAKNDPEGKALLKHLGMPFAN
jgi:large subunit ribosomal protein L5